GERRGTRADTGDALAVLHRRRAWQAFTDIGLVLVATIGGDALQAADGHRLRFDAPAATGGLAGPVADAAENAGEDVGGAVDQVGVGKPSLGDQPDVLGDIGVRGTCPLAVDDSMEPARIPGVSCLHATQSALPPASASSLEKTSLYLRRPLRHRRWMAPRR